MTNSAVQLSDKVVADLQQFWIPQLRKIREQREDTCKILKWLLLGSVVTIGALALFIFGYTVMHGTENINLIVPVMLTLLLGVPAIAAIYLAKIQECNDTLVQIEVFIYLRDQLLFVKSLHKIECLGRKMKGLIEDVAGVIKPVS
jgi:hypothetical protein